MTRNILVGRERELDRLQAAFAAACQGEARVAMLAGEPGIGKTRLAEELAAHARERGAIVLWGRARETAGAPPYWPWVQAGRTLGTLVGEEMLLSLLAADAVELQRVFPELRNVIPELDAPPEAVDAETARFRFFEAVTAVYRRLAEERVAVLVLDDLHWADRTTLLLLEHLAAEATASRLLLVGTYRDSELDRAHPLSATLVELNRLPGFGRIGLRGLSEEETASYVKAASGVDASPAVTRRIFEATAGNPFFTRELVHVLSESDQISQDALETIAVPDGVREALGRRIHRLSEEAIELLRKAAIIGREFNHETLALVTEGAGADIASLIEEPLRLRILEGTAEAGRYRFPHALMQETLLAEITLPRRALLHGEIGEALERRWGERAERYATRLAAHFAESAPLSREHAERALHYSRIAGEQAEAQYAWEEAARHYERCVSLLEGDDDARLAEMLRAHGRAALRAVDVPRAWASLMRALDIHRARGGHLAFARVALDLIEVPAPPARTMAIRQEALESPVALPPELEARLLVGSVLMGLSPAPIRRARELMSTSPLPDLEARIRCWEAMYADQPNEAERLARSAVAMLDGVGRHTEAARSYFMLCRVVLYAGELDRALRECEEYLARSERHRLRDQADFARGLLAAIHLLRCETDAHEAEYARIPRESILWDLFPSIRAEWAGDLDRALQLLPPAEKAAGVRGFLWLLVGHRCRILWRAGRTDEAQREFEAWWAAMQGEPPRAFALMLPIGEALPAVAPRDIVDEVYRKTSGAWFHFDPSGVLSIQRVRGQLALHLGLVDEAEVHFRSTAELCEREGCPVELGRCLQGLAAVAERRGEQQRALEQLQQAAALFEQHGATLYLDESRAQQRAIEAARREPRDPDGLSPREIEVLRLVAAGQSNREIAERLVVSRHTVARHVANIYGKVGVRSRSQATAYALARGLTAPSPSDRSLPAT